MSLPENASYYRDGYVKTLIRLQEEKVQYEKEILKQISAARGNSNVTAISVYDMEMSVRTTNCLIRAGLNTIGDILDLMAQDPDNLKSIRNMGRYSFNEIITKLQTYGIEANRIVS